MKKKIEIALLSLWPKGKFTAVTYWINIEKKHLLILNTNGKIKNEHEFVQLFPGTVRTSAIHFSALLYYSIEKNFFQITDENIISMGNIYRNIITYKPNE